MTRLILWDIDRTLVDIGGISRRVYADAFKSVTGRNLEHMADMAGKTDRDIIATVCAGHGIQVAANTLDRFYLALASAVRTHRQEIQVQGRALAGAAEVLVALSQVPGVVQSVVTGNIRPIAVEKLSLLGLDRTIDFEVGGYGSDDGSRAALVRLALERAGRKYGEVFERERVVVIGDTPYDIESAKQNDVRAIGVATGDSTAEELHAAHADAVIPSLADTPTVLRLVLGD